MKTTMIALAVLFSTTLPIARAEISEAAGMEELTQDAFNPDYSTPGCFSNLGLEDTLYCNRFSSRSECLRETIGLRQYRCHWNP